MEVFHIDGIICMVHLLGSVLPTQGEERKVVLTWEECAQHSTLFLVSDHNLLIKVPLYQEILNIILTNCGLIFIAWSIVMLLIVNQLKSRLLSAQRLKWVEPVSYTNQKQDHISLSRSRCQHCLRCTCHKTCLRFLIYSYIFTLKEEENKEPDQLTFA